MLFHDLPEDQDVICHVYHTVNPFQNVTRLALVVFWSSANTEWKVLKAAPAKRSDKGSQFSTFCC